jgi:DNA ligase-1
MSFKPMLAKAPKLDADNNPIVNYPLLAQPKLDGIRAAVVNGKLRTRTLKPVPNAEIRAYLERPEFEGFDGELIVGPPTADDAYRRTTSFVMAESKTGEPWGFYAFDLWNHPGAYIDRLTELRTRVIDFGPERVMALPAATVDDAAELAEVEARWLAEGHEGVILRDPDGRYKFGRSGAKGPLLKLKRFVDFEAVIVSVYEEMHNANVAMTNALGRTERSTAKAGKRGKGTLGGFYLRAINGPAEGVEFKCGTGFDAEERSRFWEDEKWGTDEAHKHHRLVGALVKVKSFPIGVKDKPRHPVFLGFRAPEDL